MMRSWLVVALACACDAHIFRGAGRHHEHLVIQHGQHLEKFPSDDRHSFAQTVLEKPQASKKKEGLLGGVLLGCMLWAICPVCIWNNERISIKQAKMRLKAERYAVHIDDPDREPLPDLNGRIVYITGESTCKDTLVDDKFPKVEAQGKIKLRRVVEMYQWIETEHKEQEGDENKVVYEYEASWKDSHQEVTHDESKKNPAMRIPSTRRQEPYRVHAISGSGDDCVAAERANVKLGAYYLSDYVIRELEAWQDKDDLSAEMLNLDGKVPEKSSDGWWYFGHELGDCRVKFEELHTGPLTVCGVLVKNQKGWSFVPIISKDAAGAGDSLVAEFGKNCCSFGVKELHFAEPDFDETLVSELEERRKEIDAATLKHFSQADTMKIEHYNPEDDIDDLCCAGPFSSAVVKLMHFIGLEDELLAVAEERKSLDSTIKGEAKAMQNKVSALRLAGLLGLMFGTYMIISPVISLLNYNIWVSMFGGALLSCMICCCGMLGSCACHLCIMSTAWLVYRPFLGLVGFAVAALLAVGTVYLMMQGQKELKAYAPQDGSSPALVALSASAHAFRYHMGF